MGGGTSSSSSSSPSPSPPPSEGSFSTEEPCLENETDLLFTPIEVPNRPGAVPMGRDRRGRPEREVCDEKGRRMDVGTGLTLLPLSAARRLDSAPPALPIEPDGVFDDSGTSKDSSEIFVPRDDVGDLERREVIWWV